MEGSAFLAQCIKEQGLNHVFGITGIPITQVVNHMQAQGTRFHGMRNEQAASYAASAAGFLTQHPGVCFTVAGPGLIHGLPGVVNSQSNGWPMILISAAPESELSGKGAFQETEQIKITHGFFKHTVRIESLDRFPAQLEQAVRISKYGRPGPVYIEIPANLIAQTIDPSNVTKIPLVRAPPRVYPDPSSVSEAIDMLKTAKRPLVILGTDAAYYQCEGPINAFIAKTQLPFVAAPMAKGLISDHSPFSAGAARSLAISKADVIISFGQVYNWLFQFGESFDKNSKFIQVNSSPESLHQNIVAHIAISGDLLSVSERFLEVANFKLSTDDDWWKDLNAKKIANSENLNKLGYVDKMPMGYHRVFRSIRETMPKDAIVVSEGANTLDVGRLVIPNELPRHRLDSGVNGTMGVGLGYAIAAAVVHPHKNVIAIEGDSAFGFSGMEVEVACRYNLRITFIVINNNGIYRGVNKEEFEKYQKEDEGFLPVTAFVPGARYDKIIEAFGGKGYYISKPDELDATLKSAFELNGPSLVNVDVEPHTPLPKNVEQSFKK